MKRAWGKRIPRVLIDEHYVVYRVVVNLEDQGTYNKVMRRVSAVEALDGFMVSWFPREDVLEVLVKWKIPDTAKSKNEALQDADSWLRGMFSLDGTVEALLECYWIDSTTNLVPTMNRTME